MSDHVGAKAPFHSTAVGKAIAAHLPERDVQELIRANGLPAVTPRTIQDPEVFRSELACVRRDGYAVDDEENVLGARCVAAPIFNMHGDVVGAISLSGPIQRLSDAHMRQIALDVRQAAVHISEKLGYMRSQ
jgi:IclR family acetate operon transcriptional repressor